MAADPVAAAAAPPGIRSSGRAAAAARIRAAAESSPAAACAGIEPSTPPSGAVGATIRAAMGVLTGGRHRRGGRGVDGVQRVQKSDLGRRSHTGSPEASGAFLAFHPSVGSPAAVAASAARCPMEEVLLKAVAEGSRAVAAGSSRARP